MDGGLTVIIITAAKVAMFGASVVGVGTAFNWYHDYVKTPKGGEANGERNVSSKKLNDLRR